MVPLEFQIRPGLDLPPPVDHGRGEGEDGGKQENHGEGSLVVSGNT